MSPWTVALVLVAVVALVAVIRPLRSPARTWDVDDRTDLDQLFESKGRALRVIKDLDHEHEAGLLTDADWRGAREDAVAEAVRLNREIAARTGIDPTSGEASR